MKLPHQSIAVLTAIGARLYDAFTNLSQSILVIADSGSLQLASDLVVSVQ
tara:strand:- start:5792 stop:5941 length:150 start_codon:yes stop_codon:yes gene_type:complete